MKNTRSAAAAMQALRLTEVRRSSSMIPILIVCRGRPSMSSTAGEKRIGERDFVRPMHFRLHDVDRTVAAVARTRDALEIMDARSAW